MIMLSANAQAAAQIDHFASVPTHAKLVRLTKMNVDTDDADLLSIAPDLKQKLEGTYAYGVVVSGVFTRTPRSPLTHVLLDVGATYASADFTPPQGLIVSPDEIARQQKRNRAALAANNLVAPGIVPNPATPWTTEVVPAKASWEFREHDFDAVAIITDARLDGTVVP